MPGRRCGCGPDPEEGHAHRYRPPQCQGGTLTCLAQARRGLRPTGVIKYPDLRRPAGSNPVAVLLDAADRDIVMGAMHSKRWHMPWSTTGCWARPWSSWSSFRPLRGSVTVQLWRRSSGAMRELLCERRDRYPRGAYHLGVVTFPVAGSYCRCDWRSDAQGGTASQDAG